MNGCICIFVFKIILKAIHWTFIVHTLRMCDSKYVIGTFDAPFLLYGKFDVEREYNFSLVKMYQNFAHQLNKTVDLVK